MAPLQHHFELVGLGRGHDRDPVLDHRRAVRGRSGSASSTPSGSRGDVTGSTGRTATPRLAMGPGARSSSPGSASRVRRGRRLAAPRRCVTVVDERDTDDAARARDACCEILGVDGPARARARSDEPCRRRRARRHLARLAPRQPRCSSRPPRAACRSGARSSSPGGCAGRSAAPWLVRHRHQRQDHDRRMLASILPRPGCAPSRAATSARRCSTRCCDPSRTTSSRSSCPASSCTGRARWRRSRPRCSTSPRTTSTGTARWRRTPRTRAGSTSGTEVACVYNVDDPVTEELVREADVAEGCRAIGFTLGVPARRHARRGRRRPRRPRVRRRAADSGGRARHASADVDPPPAPHNVANALAAAALARAVGVAAGRVRDGLRAFRPDPHRIADGRERRRRRLRRRLQGHQPARRGGVAARPTPTSSGSPAASPRARRSTSWSQRCADRLRGVVLIGATAALIAEALARHAPDVPVVEVDRHGHWGDGPRRAGSAAAWRGPGTPCCSRRPARRWTCSRLRRARRRVRRGGARARDRCRDARASAVSRAGAVGRAGDADAGGLVPAGPRRPVAPRARPPARVLLPLARRRRRCCSARPVMVFSASSVVSLRRSTARSYSLVPASRLMWVGVGLPRRCWSPSRLPAARCWRGWRTRRWHRVVVLLVLVYVPGLRRRGQRQPQLDRLRRAVPAAAVRVRQARAGLWGADLLARKRKLLDQWRHLLVPLLPVGGAAVVAARARAATSAPRGPDRDRPRRCCGWSGAPLRLFAVAGSPGVVASAASASWPATPTGMARRDWLHATRSPTRRAPGFQAGHGMLALAHRRLVGRRASARSREKWGTLPEAHTDFIFAIIGEELGLVGTLGGARAVRRCSRYAGLRIAMRARRTRSSGSPPRRHRLDRRRRRWSTSARCSACCRSPASRCRWSRTAARRCCRRCSRSACCCRFARHEPGAAEALCGATPAACSARSPSGR